VIRFAGPLTILLALVGAYPSAAKKPTTHSVEEFAAAVPSCIAALKADSLEKAAEAFEGDGWSVEKTISFGSILKQNGSSIRLELEGLFGVYTCAVLGNRPHSSDRTQFAKSTAKALEQHYPDRVSAGEKLSTNEISYSIDDQFQVVLTLDGVQGGFDTKFTAIKTGTFTRKGPNGPELATEEGKVLSAVEAVKLCTKVVRHPGKAKAMLISNGWVKKTPTETSDPFYEEPKAGVLSKGSATLIFLSENTGFEGQDGNFPGYESYPGSCQVWFPGDSPVAASAVAAEFGRPAVAREPWSGEFIQTFTFKFADYGVFLDNVASKNDLSKSTGMMRVMVVQLPK